ncbi:sodium:proton antiporter [Fundidesulfovibrio butyratiphilus]
MQEHIMLSLTGILLMGMACQWLAWRVKLPAILFLLPCGILAGPVLGWLHPAELFGDLLFPFISLAVAVILFEGSLTLQFSKIKGLGRVIRNLISLGVGITWAITTVATRFFLGFPWELALLFGAIMVVTGPTVIMPMLRTIRPKENIANVLKWEGILIDPLGACLAVMAFELILAKGQGGHLASGLIVFCKFLLVGFGLGSLAGYGFGALLKRYLFPQFLFNIATLATVCGVFTLSNMLEPESGLLTVTVMGIWLGNSDIVELDDILAFKESLSLLFISCLFIVLPARMKPGAFLDLGWGALGVFAAIQFLSRPISAQLCALGSKLTSGERHLLAWIAPRGIVSAAMAALFAFKLEALGYAQASQMVPLAFLVIVGTILLQSATAGPLARKLGAAEPEPTGALIIGAQPLSQALALELQKNGFPTLLADQDWTAIREAVMKGLPTYWGNPVSEHADRNLNLSGFKYLLAVSPIRELNQLATHYYRPQFHPENVFTIRTRNQSPVEEKNRSKYAGRYLFGGVFTYEDVLRKLREGASLKTTLLTEGFSYEEYLLQAGESRLPVFIIDPGGRLRIASQGAKTTPKAGWKVLALVRGDTGDDLDKKSDPKR